MNRIAASVGLGDVEPRLASSSDAAKQVSNALVRAFYAGAMARPKWVSDGSARIYCASRCMPLFLDGSTRWTNKHSRLVSLICQQTREKRGRFGIGEQKEGQREWYPENAYQSYWALKILKRIRDRPLDGTPDFQHALGLDLDQIIAGVQLWARERLAEEVGLHWAESATLDSDQLTWALTTFVEFGEDASSNLRDQDLIRKAFEALSSTQEKVGTWRHYRPLFVYKNLGNAYCFVYESFTYLLKAVLGKLDQDEFLEDVIRAFMEPLKRLREYAESTQVRSEKTPDVVSWSSRHRPGDSRPEGWATASVFSFLHAYRRILGVLTRRDAIRALPGSALSSDPRAIETLSARGDTWPSPLTRSDPAARPTTVAEDLITLFVNPLKMQSKPEEPEPDDQPIEEWQARSAILFGPPGASKTTLARLVAAALEWKYIELHSSHFVAEGIQQVQSTADRIFKHLMELDHAVILFDEPDELVRERDDSSDAFGRFLTTSMLPKLAELWKQRRVIYFIATNHIRYFDAAIVRSERFDLLALAPPPSFIRKRSEILKRLKKRTGRSVAFTVSRDQIENDLKALDDDGKTPELAARDSTPAETVANAPGPAKDLRLPPRHLLAKFILLRWDQIDELISHIENAAPKGRIIVNRELLTTALARVADHRLGLLATYSDYINDAKQARRDFQRKPVFLVQNFPPEEPLPPDTIRIGKNVWHKCESGTCRSRIGSYTVEWTVSFR